MSGIRSTSGVPSPVSGTAHTPATGSGEVAPANSATVTTGQSELPAADKPAVRSALPENTKINAVVTAKAGGDNVILHTEYGNFRLTTQNQLTLGSHITFEITEVEDVIHARLLAMNGKEFSPPMDVKLVPTVDKAVLIAEGYIKAGQLHPADLKYETRDLAARLGQATVSGKSPEILAARALAQPPRFSGEQLARLSIELGADGLATPTRSNPQAVANYQRQGPAALQSSPEIRPLAANAALLSKYNIVTAEVTSPNPNSAMPSSRGPVTLAAGDKINLIVRPQGAGGGPLPPDNMIFHGAIIAVGGRSATTGMTQVHLQTPFGNVSYLTMKPPIVGTTAQVAVADVISVFPLSSADVQQPGLRLPQLSPMGDWQNLRDAMNAVAAHDPLLAQTVISTVVPQADSKLSGSLLFFMSALHLGTVENWLGHDFSRSLKEAGHARLLHALEDDFATFSRLHTDNGGQDWKSLNFPFFDGNNLRQIRMFHRHHKNPEAGEDHNDTTRFVIELNLSKSGPMQLDGLFKRRFFDLTIRSQSEMPADMKNHILTLFSEHIEISGLQGYLNFKTISPFPVNPLKEWEEGL
ncbi:hypothetical protein [Sneathiella sp.]|uniref:hypothetical protein n=1 Tax=Sneathiella sp. TaxID=1964365 RepID=UPI0035623491